MPLDLNGLSANETRLLERIENDFVYEQEKITVLLGEVALALARMILITCPASKERASAVAYVNDAMRCADAAITREREAGHRVSRHN